MKQLINNLFVAVMILFCSLTYAQPGLLFKIAESGASTSADVILCLNGKGPLSCQSYPISAATLDIRTTVNHHYPAAGIKVLTPGYNATGCTPYPNGFCLFAVNSQTPAAILLHSNTPSNHKVGGTILGLVGSVSLQNNGGDTLTQSSDGSFEFATPVAQGASYNVTVSEQPATQTCTVNNGMGTMGSTKVSNVQVTCSVNSYKVGGTILGLVGSVSLQNNGGGTLTQSSDGIFEFATPVAQGASYNVTVFEQPATQTCTVNNGMGTMGSSNVSNVQVTCSANSYKVGGTILGLVGSVSLQNNGGDTLTQSNDGIFEFAIPVVQGASYNVTVSSPPATQICTVNNGSGTMGGSNVTDVEVECVASNSTTLSVSATGTIPVGSGSGSITVTNTGTTNTATNVSVTLPSGWTGVTPDSSNCTSIAPNNGTCIITFTTTTPYVAQGSIPVTGDNISNTPITALAFTVDGYLVWEVTDATTVQVIDSTDLASLPAGSMWGGFGTAIGVTAQSVTDGVSNTNAIVSGLGTGSNYAAKLCNQSSNGGAAVGAWYLPAICQMGGSGQGVGCSSGLANIDTNLVQLGFANLADDYWSSTENSGEITGNPRSTAWRQHFASGGNSGQFLANKRTLYGVRCARGLTY